MMDKKELLSAYIKVNEIPILVDFFEGKDIQEAIVLPSNIEREELCGHYEGTEYVPPKWLKGIIDNKKAQLLIIDKIDDISKEEQLKFREILESKKISTFEIPKKCVIVVTAKKISKETINEEIYSLLAHIK